VIAGGRVEQLSGPRFAPGAGASALQRLVSDVCFIIGAAKRHEVFLQALGEERDDIAVLRRGGLVRVCRPRLPLRLNAIILYHA
jgi:hypothetical protein